jgi:hypothetical protein
MFFFFFASVPTFSIACLIQSLRLVASLCKGCPDTQKSMTMHGLAVSIRTLMLGNIRDAMIQRNAAAALRNMCFQAPDIQVIIARLWSLKLVVLKLTNILQLSMLRACFASAAARSY